MFATTTIRSASEINSAMGRVYGHMGLAVQIGRASCRERVLR
jgi:hypothetical protein